MSATTASISYLPTEAGANASSWQLREETAVPEPRKTFDLLERTAMFGEAIVRFAKTIPRSPANDRLISQLVGSGTSVGANYCEADDAVSKKDFKNKIGICRKEAKECKFWLRMIAAAEAPLKSEARLLWKEASELHLILCAIFRKC
ncbi:MAG TPA: four helix bundle protein [Verrucomicrobiales bacterium]|nr:four helix bundle protein [Verrucomicrobiales bacterium]